MLDLAEAYAITNGAPFPFARLAKASELLESFEATERARIYLEGEVLTLGRLLDATRARIEDGYVHLGIDPEWFRYSYQTRGWDVENAPDDFFGPPRAAYS